MAIAASLRAASRVGLTVGLDAHHGYTTQLLWLSFFCLLLFSFAIFYCSALHFPVPLKHNNSLRNCGVNLLMTGVRRKEVIGGQLSLGLMIKLTGRKTLWATSRRNRHCIGNHLFPASLSFSSGSVPKDGFVTLYHGFGVSSSGWGLLRGGGLRSTSSGQGYLDDWPLGRYLQFCLFFSAGMFHVDCLSPKHTSVMGLQEREV